MGFRVCVPRTSRGSKRSFNLAMCFSVSIKHLDIRGTGNPGTRGRLAPPVGWKTECSCKFLMFPLKRRLAADLQVSSLVPCASCCYDGVVEPGQGFRLMRGIWGGSKGMTNISPEE